MLIFVLEVGQLQLIMFITKTKVVAVAIKLCRNSVYITQYTNIYVHGPSQLH